MGIEYSRKCMVCKGYFASVERKFTCSDECRQVLEDEFYQEKLEELEVTLAQLKSHYEEGGLSKAEFQRKWNWEIYDARNIKDLDDIDIQMIQDKFDMKEKGLVFG